MCHVPGGIKRVLQGEGRVCEMNVEAPVAYGRPSTPPCVAVEDNDASSRPNLPGTRFYVVRGLCFFSFRCLHRPYCVFVGLNALCPLLVLEL